MLPVSIKEKYTKAHISGEKHSEFEKESGKLNGDEIHKTPQKHK